MINREVAEDIIRYGQGLAVMGPQNITTGFLTYTILNQMDREDAVVIAQQSEYTVRELVRQITVSEAIPDDYDSRVLFQYVFDKVAEATYKTLVGEEVDTVLNINEAFEYHEPDLPYYMQQKITDKVPLIISVADKVLQHIEDCEYRTEDLENWFLPFLLLAVSLAMQFGLEMDLNDDSELRQFIGEE